MPLRESSGSRTSNRYDFQKDWALCHLMVLHSSGEDYCIVFEHHDDVLVLDSALNPTVCDFFQIKTKRGGHWLLSALLSREGSDHSIIGKLLLNLLTFGDHVRTLSFVSNATFNLDLDAGGDSNLLTDIQLELLTARAKNKIATKMNEEHPPNDWSGYERKVFFRVSSLSLQDHSNHAKGLLAQFLETQYPQKKYPVTTLYRTLFDEVRRRHNVELESQDLGMIVAQKGITRAGFQSILDTAAITTDDEAMWQLTITQLSGEGFSIPRLRRIGSSRARYVVERMNATNELLLDLRARIREQIRPYRIAGAPTLTQLIADVDASCAAHCQPAYRLYGPDYISSAILVEYLDDDEEGELPAADSTAKDEAE